MKSLTVALFLLSPLAHAEKLTLQIEGMHCGGCTAAVEAKACEGKGYKTCKAEITDASKKMGQLVIETNPGQKIDLKAVKADVTATKYTPKEAKVTN